MIELTFVYIEHGGFNELNDPKIELRTLLHFTAKSLLMFSEFFSMVFIRGEIGQDTTLDQVFRLTYLIESKSNRKARKARSFDQ